MTAVGGKKGSYATSAFNSASWWRHRALLVAHKGNLGVSKDAAQAVKWHRKAAEQPARQAVAILEASMTPEQIAEGKKLARNSKPQTPLVLKSEDGVQRGR